MNQPNDVAGAYDRWAQTYDADRNATRDLDGRVVRQTLAVGGRDVLELGCGTGKNTVWLAEHARHVVAMDFSEGMLARARERVGSLPVQFIRHDVREPWPFERKTFDVVVGNLVLEHVDDLRPIFAEAVRVLRPNGQFFIAELHPYRQWRGGRAHFTDRTTGETVHLTAHVHAVSEYVNVGLESGLALRHLGEWLEDDASPDAPPRLLSLLLERA